MISYEVQNALNRKADDWKVQNLENQIRSLETENRDLQGHFNRIKGEWEGLREVVLQLIDTLSEREEDDMFNRLQQLRHLL